MSESTADLPIFVKWMDFVKWLLVTTDKFPKKTRYVFVNRINDLALGVAEGFVEARYSRQKSSILARVNLDLEKMRILLRVCYELKFLPHKGYEHAMISINEVGKMLGGWLKSRDAGVR